MLPADSPVKPLVDAVSAHLRKEEIYEAAQLVATWVQQTTGKKISKPTKKEDAYALLNILLHWCLNSGATEEAAQMLWGPTQFDPRPESTQRVWNAFDTQNFILLMGAASMSKSFSMAVRLMLEWIRDPEYTTIKVLGPSEQHLEDNLFTHLVQLHKGSAIPLPGTVGALFIGLDTRARKGSIAGVVIPLGKQKGAGRLQGVKRFPRKTEHPIFGKMSRLFVFLDEIANLPGGIWRDIDNLMSNTDGDGLKIAGAFNPTDQNDEVGQRCEPPFGWKDFNPDEHFGWTSTRGWFVVRLDAARCENVVQGIRVFPGLQTKEGFERIITNSGGTNSPGYWAMARGCFPPLGTVMSIIPPGMLTDFKAEFIWYETPTPTGGVDMALEGGDAVKFAAGKWGLATGIKLPPSLKFPNGHTVMFKNKAGRPYPRYALQLDKIFTLPKGDTVAVANSVQQLASQLGIAPDWLVVDRTGNGQGVYDLLRNNWGIGVGGLNFSEGAQERKIMAEDSDVAAKLYYRAVSEIWFAMRKFVEFGYLKGVPGLETELLYPQMTGRLYRATGKESKVEGKPDYKSRHQGKSPDDADAVALLVHAARRGSGVTPGMVPDNTVSDGGDDDYSQSEREDGYVDVTNQWSTLDL